MMREGDKGDGVSLPHGSSYAFLVLFRRQPDCVSALLESREDERLCGVSDSPFSQGDSSQGTRAVRKRGGEDSTELLMLER